MEQKKWKRLSDYHSVEVKDAKAATYYYLAEPITISSTSVNKETGEEVENKETIFDAGEYMSEQKVQKLQFQIDSMNSDETLSPIVVTNEYHQPMIEQGTLNAYEVLLDLGFDVVKSSDIQKKVTVYAWRPQQAIRIASEFISIYMDYAKKYCEVLSVVRRSYDIDPDTECDITDSKEEGINYYKVDVNVNWTLKGIGCDPQHPFKTKIEYITDATEVQDAREHAVAYVKQKYKDSELLGYKVTKAQQYKADLIVPKEYSEWFMKEDRKETL